MNPNENLNKGVTKTDSFVGSRAYTFVDSYIYMKNRSYNALYDKNKEILMIENEAIRYNSPKMLYNAFFEQMRILDSVVVRMRDFSFRIKEDVLNNISMIMPDNDLIYEFEQAIQKVSLLPKFKYVKYNIKPTKYTDMAVFFNMFKNEVREFCEIKDSGTNSEKPLLHGIATEFLTNVAVKYTNYNDSTLNMEEIKIMKLHKLATILSFFKRKAAIKQVVIEDFKTYQHYLKQYKVLYNMTRLLEPTIVGNDIEIDLGGTKYKLSFNDYLVLYKHFSSMTKYILDIVNYYDSKFFNKLYAIQSNIEVFRSIMKDVVEYSKNDDVDALTESTNAFNDLYGLVNGNDATAELLMDDANDSDDDIIKDDMMTEKDMEEGVN